MIDIPSISQLWQLEEPKLRCLGENAVAIIKQELWKKELHPEISFRTKELHSLIKKIQKKNTKKEYTYYDLKDKLGIRIVCPFLKDLDVVHELLDRFFNIKKAERKKDYIDFDRLDYQSNHYDVSVRKEYINYDEEFIFEIQVRTLNQHAWANAAHILYYKQEVSLPDEMKRKIYRLLSLYELADEEFAKVNQYLQEQKGNLLYTLLRKLEGKVYKFANTDFDRDISVLNTKNILSFFSEKELENIDQHIEIFIFENESKIQHIFDENRNRYAEIPLITQPEIFLIWYGLEYYEFSITDNWDSYFEDNDLEIIRNLWC